MAKDKTINVWQYSRWTYLIGRSVKFRPFTESERAAVITFIIAMNELRPGIAGIVRGKRDNALDYSEDFKYQNDYSLGKMLQRLGRNMKQCFPVEGEKELCDALFAETDERRYQTINKYVTDEVEESSESSEMEETSSESSEAVEESSESSEVTEPETSSESSEEPVEESSESSEEPVEESSESSEEPVEESSESSEVVETSSESSEIEEPEISSSSSEEPVEESSESSEVTEPEESSEGSEEPVEESSESSEPVEESSASAGA